MIQLCLRKIVRFFLIFITFASVPLYASIQMNSEPNKRISVKIASDSMNRIAFSNDRISQVFGDEEAYTLQTDETRGQIFLKPSEANGDKPISITLTTEHNVVQDLELVPQKISTRTIILKSDVKNESQNVLGKNYNRNLLTPAGYLGSQAFNAYPNFGMPAQNQPSVESHDHVSRLVRVLKFVASQEVSNTIKEGEAPPALAISALSPEGLGVIHYQGFKVALYTLSNSSEKSYEIIENTFKGPDVLAVAVEKKQLSPGETTRLFVVRNQT